MAQTPEGKIKSKVSSLLKATPGLYYWMPVPSGFGDATLDYVGCYQGKFFSIETKAPGKKPTKRQEQTIATMERAGAKVFVIDGEPTELAQWIRATTP